MGQMTYQLRLQKETFTPRWKPVLALLIQQKVMLNQGADQDDVPFSPEGDSSFLNIYLYSCFSCVSLCTGLYLTCVIFLC